MKRMVAVRTTLLALLLTVVFSGCDTPVDYDIRGTWNYTQYHMDSLLYDNGTITFSGMPTHGDWTLYNFYDVEYVGTYTVRGTQVALEGEEQWSGNFIDKTHMEGNWRGEEDSGTWVAVMQ